MGRGRMKGRGRLDGKGETGRKIGKKKKKLSKSVSDYYKTKKKHGPLV